jgi:peroxiredoxin
MSDIRPPALREVAPDFTLPDANGASRRLADLCAQGPLVLVFYRGHW